MHASVKKEALKQYQNCQIIDSHLYTRATNNLGTRQKRSIISSTFTFQTATQWAASKFKMLSFSLF